MARRDRITNRFALVLALLLCLGKGWAQERAPQPPERQQQDDP